MMKIFIVLIVLTVFAGIVLAQDTTVTRLVFSGRVVDAVKNTPVSARVALESLPNNTDVIILQSSAQDGLFTAELHEKSAYSLIIDAEYYKPEIDTIESLSAYSQPPVFKLLPVRKGEVLLLQNIYFAQGDYRIQQASGKELAELILLMNKYPKMEIRLEGHTEKQGGRQSNLILSEKRVNEIRNYLVEHGISSKRISIKAYGDTRPVTKENTEEARKINRRVEARILKI
jgi:outer membrane protein OmpA-like peptidoglycan-associated protein